MKEQKLPEKECPECKGKLEWKLVRNNWGGPGYNGLCKKCNLVIFDREVPEITKGKAMERNGETKDIHAMDERITDLPVDVQLGILRERQKEVSGNSSHD